MDKKKLDKFTEFSSQLALPFLETFQEFLNPIFSILEEYFELKKNSGQSFIDLGAGDGRIIIYVGIHYGIRAVGIEINQNLVKEARERILLLKEKYTQLETNNPKIIHGDFFESDLSKFDYIYTFSLPTMQKSMKHILKTAKKGAILIAHKYPLDYSGFQSSFEEKYIIKHNSKGKPIFTYFYQKFKT